jgi:hypothetical protein
VDVVGLSLSECGFVGSFVPAKGVIFRLGEMVEFLQIMLVLVCWVLIGIFLLRKGLGG